jgi:hypothetical protein
MLLVLAEHWITIARPELISGNQHYSVQVEKLAHTLPEGDWIGAFQSGSLGYFHRNTVNFDGKVNAAALQARRLGNLRGYVLDSPVRWIIDWPVYIERLVDPAASCFQRVRGTDGWEVWRRDSAACPSPSERAPVPP